MFLAAVAAALLVQTAPASEPAFDADARIREAIAAVRPVAYRSAQVDWAALEAEMRQYAEGARDTADLLPAYQTLVLGLGDGHSFIQPPQDVMEAWRERHGDRRLRPDIPARKRATSAFSGRSEVESRDLNLASGRTVRAVVVPQFQGGGARGEAYADSLFDAVAQAPAGTCGYVLDLRGNGGGNVWPMLAGLSGLLGDGPQGLFRDAEGKDIIYARLVSGEARIAEGEQAGMVMARAPGWRALSHLAAMPVAVLVDDGTASSGEGVTLAFVGRADTRSFGQRTYGVASANDGFTLSDGVNLVITVSMMVDPLGRTHPEGYLPDVIVDAAAEAPVEAAQAWLATLPQCAAI